MKTREEECLNRNKLSEWKHLRKKKNEKDKKAEKKDKKDLDELMEEVDKVLQENAEEFVQNYIQRGGE